MISQNVSLLLKYFRLSSVSVLICIPSLVNTFVYFVDSYMFVNAYASILIYIQQDATLHSLFYLESALHVSGGTTTHHQERKQLYLQHLVFVTPLLLSAAIVEEMELV